ncbi:Septin-domain-containing protein [Amylocarpus encephaloides]|uniref:Septin-domain-containing protein n=1 Tax=Amylocarpus encephaloides TaxID=45428 RepID=A0A9P7YCI7_9HELO|nr:Septin-domain-containing protein [Amylocarpus encephaloides]
MRPLPGEDAYNGRSRSTSFADNDITPLAGRSQPPQMTYFLADEKSIESPHSPPSPSSLFSKYRESRKISSLGLDQDSDDQDEVRKARHNWEKNPKAPASKSPEEDLTDSTTPLFGSSAEISMNVSPSHQPRASQATISRPYTPLSYNSPAPGSLMGSPDSRRNSDVGSYLDDVASQAMVSSGDDQAQDAGPQLMDSGSAPQLIMPSIKMPSRRPFTERGKNMGRLKVMIAGDSGVGKTSLIKAIVQTCEDIVHVDPINTTPLSTAQPSRKSSLTKSRSGSADIQTTSQIAEVYASTRPYPAWWSDLEESQILRRRKSLGDSILERNLCFVDTPGYGNKTSCMECITPVLEYVESQLKKATSLEHMRESEIISLLGGEGGSQVDLVLYVIQHQVKHVDIEYLRRLSQLTNVVPVVAQADRLTQEALSSLKDNIRGALHDANIKPFNFAVSNEGISSSKVSPFAVSTTPSKDHENMDASLLMSPDYVSPLLPSELSILVSKIFESSNVSWLRHSAAKKFIQWRKSTSPLSRPLALYQPLRSSSISSSQMMTEPVVATTSYTLARITDHTQREERIAQVRLANWAADLQRSLQNERARFDALARNERAVWLTERLGECVQDGSIIPLSEARKQDDGYSSALVKRCLYAGDIHNGLGGIDRRDPLGLLQMSAEMRRTSWAVAKLLSGVGILGGLSFWVAKTWQGTEGQLTIWGMGVRDWADLGVANWT